MRPVNLLPARYRPRTGGAADSRVAYGSLGALALLLLAVFGYVMTANQVSSRNSEIAEVRQQIAAAQAQAVTLKGYGDFAGTKQARLTAVKSLATARVDWERLFRELAHVLPDRVWLTSFEAQATAADGGAELGPTLLLKGCASSHSQIADVMVRLRELHVAEDVELQRTLAPEDEEAGASAGATAEGGSDCGPYYAFDVNIAMELPSTAALDDADPAVPARLGGGS